MKYTKPVLFELASAFSLIQGEPKPSSMIADNHGDPDKVTVQAYEADE